MYMGVGPDSPRIGWAAGCGHHTLPRCSALYAVAGSARVAARDVAPRPEPPQMIPSPIGVVGCRTQSQPRVDPPSAWDRPPLAASPPLDRPDVGPTNGQSSARVRPLARPTSTPVRPNIDPASAHHRPRVDRTAQARPQFDPTLRVACVCPVDWLIDALVACVCVCVLDASQCLGPATGTTRITPHSYRARGIAQLAFLRTTETSPPHSEKYVLTTRSSGTRSGTVQRAHSSRERRNRRTLMLPPSSSHG